MAIAEKAIEGALGLVAGEAFTRIRTELRRFRAVEIALDSYGRPREQALRNAIDDIRQVLGTRKGQLSQHLEELLTALRTSGLLSQLAEAAIILDWSEAECENSLKEISGLRDAFRALFSTYIQSDVYDFEGARFTSDQLLTALLRMLETSISLQGSAGSRALMAATERSALLNYLRRIDTQIGQLIATSSRQAHLQATSITGLQPDETVRKLANKLETALNWLWVYGPDGRTRRVPIDDLFVPLSLTRSVNVADQRLTPSRPTPISFDSFLHSFSRAVILGHPGGGKSTFGQRICLALCKKAKTGDDKLPIRVVIREYEAVSSKNSSVTLMDYIVSVVRKLEPACTESEAHDVVSNLLLFGRVCLFFDGLDEIIETGRRRQFVEEVEVFSDSYPLCPVLVTSRSIGYDQAPLRGGYDVYYLTQFEREQSVAYFEKISVSQFGISSEDAVKEAYLFNSKLGFEASDLVANPLLLSLMCWLYHERRGDVPTNKARIYEECSLLMFQRWDRSRSIDTPQIAETALFDLITSLAAQVYENPVLNAGFSKAWLLTACESFFFQMFDVDRVSRSKSAAQDLVDYLTGRAWVLTEKGSGIFDFTHRTFLEYFFGRHLVEKYKSASILINRTFQKIRRGQWHLPINLALQHYARVHRQSSKSTATTLIKHLTRKQEQIKNTNAITKDVLAFATEACEYLNLSEPELSSYTEALCQYGFNVDDGEAIFYGFIKTAAEKRPTILSKIVEYIIEDGRSERRLIAGRLADLVRASRYFLWFGESELHSHGLGNMATTLSRCRRHIEVNERLRKNEGFRARKLIYDLVGLVDDTELRDSKDFDYWSDTAGANWFLVDAVTVVEGLSRSLKDVPLGRVLIDACEFGKKVAPSLLRIAPIELKSATIVWTGTHTGIEDVCAVCRGPDRAAALAAVVFTFAALDLYGEWPTVARFARGKEAEVIRAKRRLVSAYTAGAHSLDPYVDKLNGMTRVETPLVLRPRLFEGIQPKDILVS